MQHGVWRPRFWNIFGLPEEILPIVHRQRPPPTYLKERCEGAWRASCSRQSCVLVDFKTVRFNSLGEPMSFRNMQVVPEPALLRKSISEMFDGLDTFEQRALIDRLALLPHQINRLATEGVIAAEIVLGPSATVGSR